MPAYIPKRGVCEDFGVGTNRPKAAGILLGLAGSDLGKLLPNYAKLQITSFLS